MPRTSEELEEAAADFEQWLDELDPAVLDDPANRADDLRAITSARDVIAVGEGQLANAVAAARANGRSWGEIGLFLGVSKQAARKRFGGRADQPSVKTAGAGMPPVSSIQVARQAVEGFTYDSGTKPRAKRTKAVPARRQGAKPSSASHK
jgi:hypothetical protein